MNIGCQIKLEDNLIDILKKAKRDDANILQTFLTKTPYSTSKKNVLNLNNYNYIYYIHFPNY